MMTISIFYHFALPTIDTNTFANLSYFASIVHPLLQKFSVLFQESQDWPSTQTNTHHIHLVPNASPVNMHSYRYLYYQKQQMKKLVHEMSQSGIIRHNTGMFSFPLLSVEKEKGMDMVLLS